ncbi:MAG: hypothetical protein IJO32_06125 [Bacilli bacterium]|nr:hypothetical protein [Bacilli bacterium]
MNYINTLNDELKNYLLILCKKDKETFDGLSKYLNDYINTKPLQRLKGIGQFCGVDYQKLPIHDVKYWYSRLDHSIVCAFMTYNYTSDLKQTLGALFHDVGTPVFSHCIDFMLNDSKNQESSEKSIYDILKRSNDVLDLLKRDNITLEEITQIEKYPIVENKKPKICVDRLDGILTTGLVWGRYWNIDDIEKIYNSTIISKNENKEDEISFNNIEVAEMFFDGAYKYSMMLQANEDKISMNFLGDIVKKAIDKNIITYDELYILDEKEMIEIFESSNNIVLEMWNIFKNLDKVYNSDEKNDSKYCISLDAKKRYVNPLCNIDGKINRLCDISLKSANLLKKYMKYKDTKYAYIDYDINNKIRKIEF